MKYKKSREATRLESNGDGGGGSHKGGGGDVPPSIQLDIMEHRAGGGGGLGTGGPGSASFFEPWREPTPGSGSGHGSSGRPAGGREPPEKRLTLFALRLAVLEKAASGLGKLDFVWATVVLLGGFASTLSITDFWCVTVILVGEGARVFSRSHELEWQHHATQTSTAGGALRSSSRFFRHIVRAIVDPAAAATGGGGGGGGGRGRARDDDARARAALFQRQIVAFMRQRAWHAPDVSLLPYTGWVFVSRKIGRLLNWLQVLSALACVALSVIRLWKHDFGGADSRNMRPALLLFYTLALLEASLFLFEKAYWTWKVSVCKLLHQVSDECELGAYGLVSLKRFFYDAYSRCIAGSIFDGIKMDLVTFAEELVLSDFLDEQLIGVRILQQFANSERSASDTLRKVGTTPRSIERLVEMLNWKRPEEEEVRRCAAEIVSKLAGKSQNALRVSGIPGSIESVTSLLYTGRGPPVSGMHPRLPGAPADADHGASPASRGYDHLPFNLLGLLILKRLARDHDNCGKIGNARGLLAKVINFTQASPVLLRNPHVIDSQVSAVKRALKVVKMLVSTTGNTGKALRESVAENVFTVSNLRDILRYGQQHRELQKLATDVLTGLAMEDSGKEAIVATGGVVKLLLSMFFDSQETELGCEAGEALAMLALESEAGCAAILRRADVMDQLVSALQDGDARRLNAARVLRNLCAYSGQQQREERLRLVTTALPAVLNATMVHRDKILEVSVGLTTEICRFIDGERFAGELRRAGVADERAYVERLASILRQYRYPEIRVPRMRRFVVQQVIWLMTNSGGRGDDGGGYVELLREVGMQRLLESVADTTSELECYHVFSGSVGISKHRESFSDIVDSALVLIAGSGDRARDED
ncbi:uncharacterized protein LOC8080792 [Sorghum bicolor]|uniref:Uncharacterized protein n=2 Tax=Sorghum bicolor TaxID=4558 RepID=C5WZK3_SORBI|nr:uncharacterized protein LOC8080792 [Sorghum bicolor]EER94819.1 hypothetical protein SORBI_3001G363300 [Sorghum bicolor]|eukprot:XP_002467821.1 uncharacterized protein LOC8080792 [Sorghum bicolor]